MPSKHGGKSLRLAGLVFLAARGLSPQASAAQLRRERAEDYAGWVKSGETLRDAGKDAEAEAAFQKALTFPSGDFRAEAALAQINSERGRWREAAEFYERARRKAPKNYVLCAQLARTYADMGRVDLAKRTFAEANSLDPKQADAYVNEGYEQLRAGDYARASEQFQNAIAIDTSSPYGYHHMASYFTMRGDFVEAERYLKKTLELLDAQPRPHEPRHVDAVLHATCNLARVLDREGRLDEAESILRRALPAAPLLPWRAQILDLLARMDIQRGKRAQAEELFQQAASLCPSAASCARFPLDVDTGPLVHLASLYADAGRKAQALETADKAWSRYPAAERIRQSDLLDAVEVGELYSRLGDDAKAERAYRLIISQRDRMPATWKLAYAQAMLACLCGRSGKYKESFGLFRDLIRVAYQHGKSRNGIRRELGLGWSLLRVRLKSENL